MELIKHLTAQKSIGSGFHSTSINTDVIKGIDLTNKIVIVTGGYAGIGLETTKTLPSAGATVIVPVRDKTATAFPHRKQSRLTRTHR